MSYLLVMTGSVFHHFELGLSSSVHMAFKTCKCAELEKFHQYWTTEGAGSKKSNENLPTNFLTMVNTEGAGRNRRFEERRMKISRIY